MIAWSFFLGPLVGGVIGGITNKLAIKMLFSPYEAKYVWGWHIPLTPGIIPKEKGRIASAIGTVVSGELLNSEVLSETLLSDEMEQKIGKTLNSFYENMSSDDEQLNNKLLRFVEVESMEHVMNELENDVTEAIYHKLNDPMIGTLVARLSVEQVIDKLSSSGILGRIGSSVLSSIRESVEYFLAENINEMLHSNGRSIVSDLVHKEFERVLSMPVGSLVRDKEELFSHIKIGVLRAYKSFVSVNLSKVLSALNLEKVIESRINSLNMAETERLILSIMDKELKALVWFGVGLGFLMGFVTNLMYLI